MVVVAVIRLLFLLRLLLLHHSSGTIRTGVESPPRTGWGRRVAMMVDVGATLLWPSGGGNGHRPPLWSRPRPHEAGSSSCTAPASSAAARAAAKVPARRTRMYA